MIAVPRGSSLPIIPTLVLAILATTALALTLGASGAAGASKYRSCSLSAKEKDVRGKPTYNLTLKRIGTTCATAKKVMKGYHACRSRSSVRCSRKVASKWRCTATKTSSIATQFDARYTCSSGRRRVRGTYQQST